ncbi:Alpha-L-fucosidase [Chlamydia trachomatis]|nr:Alpha-L-fucosidase [Chlamydia trachomatis]
MGRSTHYQEGDTASKTIKTMKRLRRLLLTLTTLIALTASAQTSDWYGDKYSLFIHYGLYSIPGGIFQGEPVRRGYSEQILTFGIGFSDWYEAYAQEFDATKFDARAIVALAQKSGMRSVVMTSKHHDGFCLFDTKTTDYNVMNTPAQRDLIGELAEACHQAGIGFGIYFSLIDWHYPYAVPFTSHNADPITPPHHQYNMAQVRELLTQYGRIDELWFDMGSLTTQQSAELYTLVHQLQPECMVSGRLGNDYADFCVMADNEYPDYQMAMPWQTAASIFDETWGYRSWQERGSVEAKVEEKLTALLKVVAYGGKYLLNIGPKGDGSIVPFEAEVLQRIGEELAPFQEAIYQTHPAATPHQLATLSADRSKKFIFQKKGTPAPKGARLIASDTFYQLYQTKYISPKQEATKGALTPLNATPLLAHSSADYYASFQSIVGYQWTTPRAKSYTLTYPSEEIGRQILLNGKPLTLQPQQSTTIPTPQYHWGSLAEAPQRGRMGTLATDPEWHPSQADLRQGVTLPMGFSSGQLFRQEIRVDRATELPLTITYTDGVLIYLNGQYIDGAIHREAGNATLQLLLPLRKGDNQITIKLYNRWAKASHLQIEIPSERLQHQQQLRLPKGKVTLTKLWQVPLASPAHLSALRLK